MRQPVLDASAVVAGLMRDERNEDADTLLEQIAKIGGVVPTLFWDELRSVLLILERKKRLEAGTAEVHLSRVRGFGLKNAADVPDNEVVRMARFHDLTGYDAVYATTAAACGLPLATFDKALIRAGKGGAFDLWSPTSAPPT